MMAPETLGDLSDEEYAHYEELLSEFEEAWRTGQQPAVEGLLPRLPEAGWQRRLVLCELVKIDLEYRWQPVANRPGSPERYLLEAYVAKFVDLGPVEQLTLSLIDAEYRVRSWAGEHPTHAEYLQRFGHSAGLEELLRQADAERAQETSVHNKRSASSAEKTPALSKTSKPRPRKRSPRKGRRVVPAAAALALATAVLAVVLSLARNRPQRATNEPWVEHPSTLPSRSTDNPAAALPSPLDDLNESAVPALDRRLSGVPRGAGLVAVLGDQRLRHWSAANTVALAPSGQFLVSCGAHDPRFAVWDAVTGERRFLATAQKGYSAGFAFSSDSKLLAVARTQTSEEAVQLWDLSTEKCLTRFPHPAGVIGIAATREGLPRLLTGTRSGVVRLYDLAHTDHPPLVEFLTEEGLTTVAIAADGSRAAAGYTNGKIRSFDLSNHQTVGVAEHPKGVNALAFAPNGRLLASVGGDPGVRIWDAKAQLTQTLAGHRAAVRTVVFAADGRCLITGGEDAVFRWAVADGRFGERCHLGPTSERALALATDQTRLLAVADGTPRLQLWDLQRDAAIVFATQREKASQEIRGMAFSPDARSLVSVGYGPGLCVRTLAGPAVEPPPQLAGNYGSVQYSPDGQYLLTCGLHESVGLWKSADLDAGPWKRFGTESDNWIAAFSPDGRRIALAGYGGQVEICYVEQDLPSWKFSAYELGVVQTVTFSPDGTRLATAGNELKLWDITGKIPRYLPLEGAPNYGPVRTAAFSPDGRWLATSGNSQPPGLWDIRTGKRDVAPAGGPKDVLQQVAFSADGRYLAVSGLETGTVAVWERTDFSRPLRIWELPGPIREIAFAPDSRHLATVNGNGTIYLFRIAASE